MARGPELGWTEIACHVWQEETADELLAIEIEENTCRAQLTLVEAERAWHRYRDLLGVIEGKERERDATGTFVAKPQPDWPGQPGQVPYEKAAAATGYSDRTLRRVEEIRETAEDETEPEPVREAAKQEYRNLRQATGGAKPALERVRAEKRKATRAAMSPGQWLKSDEPQAPARTVTWYDRLWEVVGSGRQIRKTAEELELDPDTSALPTGDITKMAELLQEQIRDRQYLRKVLLSIKDGRK